MSFVLLFCAMIGSVLFLFGVLGMLIPFFSWKRRAFNLGFFAIIWAFRRVFLKGRRARAYITRMVIIFRNIKGDLATPLFWENRTWL